MNDCTGQPILVAMFPDLSAWTFMLTRGKFAILRYCQRPDEKSRDVLMRSTFPMQIKQLCPSLLPDTK